jgi:hypothetical protein
VAQSQPDKRWLSPLRQDTFVLLSSFPGGTPILRPTFRFPFIAFFDTNGSGALCLFSSLVFWDEIFEPCLRGAAFVVLDCGFYWIRCRAIWNYANVLIFSL